MVQTPQLLRFQRVLAGRILAAVVANAHGVVDVPGGHTLIRPAEAAMTREHLLTKLLAVRGESRIEAFLSPAEAAGRSALAAAAALAGVTCGTKSRWLTTRQPDVLVCI